MANPKLLPKFDQRYSSHTVADILTSTIHSIDGKSLIISTRKAYIRITTRHTTHPSIACLSYSAEPVSFPPSSQAPQVSEPS